MPTLMSDMSQNHLSTLPTRTDWTLGAECSAWEDNSWWYCMCKCVCVSVSLMSDLNKKQLSTPPPRTDWKPGAECVACRDDGQWYRAKITDIGDDHLYRVTPLSSLVPDTCRIFLQWGCKHRDYSSSIIMLHIDNHPAVAEELATSLLSFIWHQ